MMSGIFVIEGVALFAQILRAHQNIICANSPTEAKVFANWGCLPKNVVFGGNVIYLEII